MDIFSDILFPPSTAFNIVIHFLICKSLNSIVNGDSGLNTQSLLKTRVSMNEMLST